MRRLVLSEVEEVIFFSKNRNAAFDIDELLKFLRYFEFILSADAATANSEESRRATWNRFVKEAMAQNVLFELKNCGSYHSLWRVVLDSEPSPATDYSNANPVMPTEQMAFDFNQNKSA